MRRIIGLIFILLIALAAYAVWDSRDLPPAELEARYTDETSRFIEAGSARIHYRDQGEGPTILLIHGYSTHLLNWDAWANELAKDYRVIRLDLPGHGLTGPHDRGDYSPIGQTEAVVAFIDALDLNGVTLIGNSLGGLIAWRYALEHPEKTSALVLVDAGGFLGPDAVENEPGDVPASVGLLRYIFPEFLARAVMEKNYADDDKVTDEIVRRYRDLIRREGNRGALIAALRQFVLYEPTEALGRIDTPTLILWGGADEVLPVSDARKFHAAMPNSELIILDGLGHMPMKEAPGQSLPPVEDFLARHLPPAESQAMGE